MRSEAPGGNPAGRIVVRFALTSFIVLVLVGVAITQFRAHDLRNREERSAASRAELLATEVVAPALSPTCWPGRSPVPTTPTSSPS